jgi:adenylate cyclase
MTVTRRLAAILAAEVVGFSKLIGEDEAGTLAALREIRKGIVNPVMTENGGRIFKLMGDGLLAEFPSAVQALQAAIGMQQRLHERNAEATSGKPINVRIGIHQGDVVIEGNDLLGDGVNIAARLEALAEPGGICISGRVHEDVTGKIKLEAQDMGDQSLKNIARSVRAYRVSVGSRVTGPKADVGKPALALPDKPSIAVLPFQNMSGDPEQEYFADGMVEEIITALSRFRQLFVIARNSSFTYKGRAVNVKQVGRELGVRYVLEGGVRKSSNRVRITGQLIDATNGAHLWADRFEGSLDDIFELQDRVTASVVRAIAPKLEQVEINRSERKSTESLDAYDYYLRGLAARYNLSDRKANDEALQLVKRAIELDRNFASAHAVAAICYLRRKLAGWMIDAPTEIAEATQLARRASELDRDDALSLSMAGAVFAYVGGDLDSGAALVERALLLNPNLPEAQEWSGWINLWLGHPDDALRHFQCATQMDSWLPAVSALHAAIAFAHFHAGRYNEASLSAAVALRQFPDFQVALRAAAASNALAGNLELAERAMTRLRQIDPELRISNLGRFWGPYRRPEDFRRFAEAMRKAGLPE